MSELSKPKASATASVKAEHDSNGTETSSSPPKDCGTTRNNNSDAALADTTTASSSPSLKPAPAPTDASVAAPPGTAPSAGASPVAYPHPPPSYHHHHHPYAHYYPYPPPGWPPAAAPLSAVTTASSPPSPPASGTASGSTSQPAATSLDAAVALASAADTGKLAVATDSTVTSATSASAAASHPPPPHAYYHHPTPHHYYYPPPPQHHRWPHPTPSHPHYPGYAPPTTTTQTATTSESTAVVAAAGTVAVPEGSLPPGPYRYSDPTLRRDALTRMADEKSKVAAAATAMVAGKRMGSSANGGRLIAPDPAAQLFLDLENREGATSPSQIEEFHREEVTTMGCTCKKTKCLKLYCQCFAVKIYCGTNCRCMVCRNTPQHENERQESIRAILSRNPMAFETKFQKNANAAKAVRPELGPSRVLSHKLGCKCRKSACMKKYCECYAGNVKCSLNCRCVGCKNMPPEGLPPLDQRPRIAVSSPKNPPATVHEQAASIHAQAAAATASGGGIALRYGSGGGGGGLFSSPGRKDRRPPKGSISDAAQNLAFLKHGSPEPKRTHSVDKSEASSMPSLTSLEESHGGGDSTGRSKPEKTAVNALLMAAMVMTEQAESGDSKVAATPPTMNDTPTVGKQDTPESVSTAADNYETPQRNLMSKFASPKRKAIEATKTDAVSARGSDHEQYRNPNMDDENEDDESPKLDYPGDGDGHNAAPSEEGQKVKRSRCSARRSSCAAMDLATPAKGGDDAAMPSITPVTARIIDFKKMRVGDSPAPTSAAGPSAPDPTRGTGRRSTRSSKN